MKYTVQLILALLLTACAAPAGGLKATIFTSPPTYLKEFPLDTISEADMLARVGPPDKVVDAAGKKRLVYQMGNHYGQRTFSYELTGGMVTDVIYNDNGPYNGLSARNLQGN